MRAVAGALQFPVALREANAHTQVSHKRTSHVDMQLSTVPGPPCPSSSSGVRCTSWGTHTITEQTHHHQQERVSTKPKHTQGIPLLPPSPRTWQPAHTQSARTTGSSILIHGKSPFGCRSVTDLTVVRPTTALMSTDVSFHELAVTPTRSGCNNRLSVPS